MNRFRFARSLLASLGLYFFANSLWARELPPEFDFYFYDFKSHQLAFDDPLARLISERLAESVFSVKTGEEVVRLLRLIEDSLAEQPERWPLSLSLHRALEREFEKRLALAKTKRKIYSATGAVIGVLVAIPAGYMLSKAFGSQLLWLVVPVGGLAGAGFGFLLSDLRYSPPRSYDRDLLSQDLDRLMRRLDSAKEISGDF
ncbi:MAG: hypothetical protein EA369_03710 [Bradymonadales bacterium]|nr:MAG: hypothetical protein EA369_03710 [Bradymonadales bacterium]